VVSRIRPWQEAFYLKKKGKGGQRVLKGLRGNGGAVGSIKEEGAFDTQKERSDDSVRRLLRKHRRGD